MNINDIWSGLLAIYDRVTPALLITIAAFLAVFFTCRGLSLRNALSNGFSRLSKSKTLADFDKTVNKLRIGPLVPVIAVVILLAYLVILGDLVAWSVTTIPTGLQASYTPIDILAEQRNPEDLATVATIQLSGGESPPTDLDSSRPSYFFGLTRYYERQRKRLLNKYPERFKGVEFDTRAHQSLYGGFLILTVMCFVQLVARKVFPNRIWFHRTTALRTILVFLLLLTLTARYRLQWEWEVERYITRELNVTADLLHEENKLSESDILKLKEQVRAAQRAFAPHQFWLARHYERLTLRMWAMSNRQLG